MILAGKKLVDTSPKRKFFFTAAFTSSFSYLSGGVFLNGLAVLMGAGETLQGYISIIISLSGVTIIILSPFLAKIKSRKKLAIVLITLSRIITFFIAVIPLAFTGTARLVIFVVLVILAFSLQAQATVAINQWMLTFIDGQNRGKYISLRQSLYLSVNIVLSFSAGFLMDNFGGGFISFVILFAIATSMCTGEVILLSKTDDAIQTIQTQKNHRLRDFFILPFRDKKFFGFCVFIFFFFMLFYIGNSFVIVYLRTYLQLPYLTTTLLYLITSVPQIFLLPFFGRLNDKKGCKFVLNLAVWFFVGEVFFHFFSTKNSYFIFIPLSFFSAAIANGAFTASSFGRRYELMPADYKLVYDNFYTATLGLGIFFGPLIGGALKDWFATDEQIMNVVSNAQIRLLFLISAGGLVALQLVRIVIELIVKQYTKKIISRDLALQTDNNDEPPYLSLQEQNPCNNADCIDNCINDDYQI